MPQELINPRGVFKHEENPIAPRLSDLNGKILGLLDNGKDNADLFLDCVEALVTKKYSISKVLRIKKLDGSAAAPLTQEFYDSCNFIINAIGD